MTEVADKRAGARGVMIFLVGFAGALLAAGLGWLVIEPPVYGATWPLLLTVAIYVLPVLVMGVGTAISWADSDGPRVVLAVVAAFAAFAFAPTVARALDDLSLRGDATPAIVLANYDCDYADQSGVRESLTCVELAWTEPEGGKRARFVLGDDQVPERPLVRGTCVLATLWPKTERVVALRVVGPAACRDRALR